MCEWHCGLAEDHVFWRPPWQAGFVVSGVTANELLPVRNVFLSLFKTSLLLKSLRRRSCNGKTATSWREARASKYSHMNLLEFSWSVSDENSQSVLFIFFVLLPNYSLFCSLWNLLWAPLAVYLLQRNNWILDVKLIFIIVYLYISGRCRKLLYYYFLKGPLTALLKLKTTDTFSWAVWATVERRITSVELDYGFIQCPLQNICCCTTVLLASFFMIAQQYTKDWTEISSSLMMAQGPTSVILS